MTDSDSTTTLPSILQRTAWTVLPVTLGLWGIGLLTVCGVALGTCWRVMEMQNQQQTAQIKLSREFHAGLIREIRDLTGHAAATVTNDLCRVRFRLRMPKSLAPPAGRYRLCLLRADNQFEGRIEAGIREPGEQQIADFGLLPPGRYQLQIDDALGMQCRHGFEVTLGVPVDRVAYCPQYQDWMFGRQSSRFQLQLELPVGWESRPIVTVVHLRSGSTSSKGWNWRPPQDQQFDVSTMIAGNAAPLAWDDVWSALPSSLTGETMTLPSVVAPQGRQTIDVPYACCEAYGLSFVLAGSADSSDHRHLGTFLFDDEKFEDVRRSGAAAEVVYISRACPRQICTSSEPVVLSISVPEVIASTILYNAQRQTPGGK